MKVKMSEIILSAEAILAIYDSLPFRKAVDVLPQIKKVKELLEEYEKKRNEIVSREVPTDVKEQEIMAIWDTDVDISLKFTVDDVEKANIRHRDLLHLSPFVEGL